MTVECDGCGREIDIDLEHETTFILCGKCTVSGKVVQLNSESIMKIT